MARQKKTSTQAAAHRPNGLVAELRSNAKTLSSSFISKATKSAKASLKAAKKSGPSIISTLSVAKMQRILSHK